MLCLVYLNGSYSYFLPPTSPGEHCLIYFFLELFSVFFKLYFLPFGADSTTVTESWEQAKFNRPVLLRLHDILNKLPQEINNFILIKLSYQTHI